MGYGSSTATAPKLYETDASTFDPDDSAYDEAFSAEDDADENKDLWVGMKLRGKVEQFSRSGGVFCRIGRTTIGFLHLSEISSSQDEVLDPAELLQLGEEIDVFVKRLRPDGGVELTLRDFGRTLDELTVGKRFKGKVVHMPNFGGVFVDIGAMRQGYVPRSAMSMQQFHRETEIVSMGDEIDVWVTQVDKTRGIKLSMLRPRFPQAILRKGMKLQGVVRKLSDGQAQVDVFSERRGIVKIAEVEALPEPLHEGQDVVCWVTDVRQNGGFYLTLREPQIAVASLRPGMIGKGYVVEMLEQGLLMDIGTASPEYVPLSAITGDPPAAESEVDVVIKSVSSTGKVFLGFGEDLERYRQKTRGSPTDVRMGRILTGTVTSASVGENIEIDVGREKPAILSEGSRSLRVGDSVRVKTVATNSDGSLWVDLVKRFGSSRKQVQSNRKQVQSNDAARSSRRSERLRVEDLRFGQPLKGKVHSLPDKVLAAFVDVGAQRNAILWNSDMSTMMVRDAAEVLTVGQSIEVWVNQLDSSGRIGVTMVKPGTGDTFSVGQKLPAIMPEHDALQNEEGVTIELIPKYRGEALLPQDGIPDAEELAAHGVTLPEAGSKVPVWVTKRPAKNLYVTAFEPETDVKSLRVNEKRRATFVRYVDGDGGAQIDLGLAARAFAAAEDFPRGEAVGSEVTVWVKSITNLGVTVTGFNPKLPVGRVLRGTFESFEEDGLLIVSRDGSGIVPYSAVPAGKEMTLGEKVLVTVVERGLPAIFAIKNSNEGEDADGTADADAARMPPRAFDFESIGEDKVLAGTVETVESYGIFVRIADAAGATQTGLLPSSELPSGSTGSSALQPGQAVTVKIAKHNKENGMLYLSLLGA
eukprot:TRINITY_DN100443_c0_g1_i1.p1 TRINITY_DN100443_c0_g1~~TRINITY_DN100443_c0_g1_i1.p1  ORF type:complete len:990 (-),score=142.86 TRINITY_DN100443_c0_g1_i1:80-2680(-)